MSLRGAIGDEAISLIRLLRHFVARNDKKLIGATCVLVCVVSVYAFSAESHFITIQKLELKKENGEWLGILEPDHKVDLTNTDAAVSFFNNGRVPPEKFKNFKVTFDDQGKKTEMSFKKDLDSSLLVKKGSFVSVSFELEEESKKVKQMRWVVDAREFVDQGDNIEVRRTKDEGRGK
jgi:hypothetical protein